MDTRKRTREIVEVAAPGDRASQVFDISILALIFLNVVAVIADSVDAVHRQWGAALHVFEVVSVAIFTVEYLARLWSCTADPRYEAAFRGRIRFALGPMSVVDLLAIAPFYLPFVGVDLRSLRTLRLFRLVRVAKVGRYYSSLRLIKHVFRSKREELVLTTALMAMLLVVASTLLYFCENAEQPEVFSSIPATMWWAVATLTTVGYGDKYPITVLGKLFAGSIAVLGIGMFALPTAIIGAGFVEEIQRTKEPSETCPHCGREVRQSGHSPGAGSAARGDTELQ